MRTSYTLLTFARRRALSTLRANNPAMVAAGIDAVSMIDAERIDWRDAVIATALLAYAGGRIGLDVSAALTAAASASEPGIGEILLRFAHEPVHSLDDWGYRELSTGSGIVFASDGGEPFAPSVDLVSVAMAIAGLFDGDVWRVSDVETAAKLPAVWLRAGNEAAVESALGSIVACVTVNGELAATALPKAANQQLTVWLVECSDARAAGIISGAPGPAPPAGSRPSSPELRRLRYMTVKGVRSHIAARQATVRARRADLLIGEGAGLRDHRLAEAHSETASGLTRQARSALDAAVSGLDEQTREALTQLLTAGQLRRMGTIARTAMP